MIDIIEQTPATLAQLMMALYDGDPAVMHRNIYRGSSLGTSVTATQKEAIKRGTFEDIYIGDYWTINSRVYRVADIDYYLNTGDIPFTDHHLVIVPDSSFGNDKMNTSNTTAGGYTASLMYTDTETPSVLNTARDTIGTDFGTALATHRIWIPTTTGTGGVQTEGGWFDSTVDLMTEVMVYGCDHNQVINTGANESIQGQSVETEQLALFALNPRIMFSRSFNTWLRDVASASTFAFVSYTGAAYGHHASNSYGVRPAFCITGN